MICKNLQKIFSNYFNYFRAEDLEEQNLSLCYGTSATYIYIASYNAFQILNDKYIALNDNTGCKHLFFRPIEKQNHVKC